MMLHALPESLQNLLLVGASGRLHMLKLTKAAHEAGRPELIAPFLLSGWEQDLLNGRAAAQAMSTAAAIPDLNPAVLETLGRIAATDAPPPRPTSDPARRLETLAKTIPQQSDELDLWRELVERAPYGGESETCIQLLHDHWPEELAALKPLLMLQFHLLRGDFSAAAEEVSCCGPWRGRLLCEQMAAHALLGAGRRDEGTAVLAKAAVAHPWALHLSLRLFDLLSGRDRDRRAVPGECAVLLFSFNKAYDLDRTLASLAVSDAAEAPIFALDNGSTDETPAVLQHWEAAAELSRFTAVRLPTNIGAPAARNWLLTLEAVRACEYVVFLDDDTAVERDWLSRLGAAVAASPEAGVWGAKVQEFDCPAVTQSADLNLLPPEEGREERFTVSDLHLQGPDLGQFDYLRPCLSVTGCCHLFKTSRLLEAGGFDIRFAPTQFDDLDRDLRAALTGDAAVYQGHMGVRHRKRSGGRNRDPVSGGNARGNEVKLFAKYSPAKVRMLLEKQRAVLLEDYLRKTVRISREASEFGPGT